MKSINTLVVSDIKNITRDFILGFCLFLPVLLVLVFRFMIPFISGLVRPYFDLHPYFTFIFGIYLLVAPMMYGWVTGFLLLDERDENTLVAISITPLGKTGYLLYRIITLILVNYVFIMALSPLTGLIKVNILKLFPVAMLSSLEAPLFALMIASFAGNKVEGLAFAKGLGLLIIPCFVGLTIPAPWHYFGGIFPTYWVTQSVLSMNGSAVSFLLNITGGIVVHGVWLVVMLYIFNRREG